MICLKHAQAYYDDERCIYCEHKKIGIPDFISASQPIPESNYSEKPYSSPAVKKSFTAQKVKSLEYPDDQPKRKGGRPPAMIQVRCQNCNHQYEVRKSAIYNNCPDCGAINGRAALEISRS